MIDVPNTCQFCRHFPCLPQDKEATVMSEIKGSYPFRAEEDSFKPCEGESFIPAIVEQISEDGDEPVLKKIEVVLPPVPTEKLIYILKASQPKTLQDSIDNVTKGEEVISFAITAMTSAFDSESAKMDIVAALEVVVDKAKWEAQNAPVS